MRVTKAMVLMGVVLIPVVALATVGAGFLTNVILAPGSMPDSKIVVRIDDWATALYTRGESDTYFQDVMLAPGGYSGWHYHSGILMITVKAGAVDWYDKDCNKQTYVTGQTFIEGNSPHELVNSGSVDADV